MKEFVLKRHESKKFKVEIDGEHYEIPLSGGLTTKEVKTLDTVDGTLSFVKKYIPEEVVDSLTQDEYNELVKAWGEASKSESGLTAGE